MSGLRPRAEANEGGPEVPAWPLASKSVRASGTQYGIADR